MRKLLLSCLITSLGFTTHAQDSTKIVTSNQPEHKLGLSASTTTGVGLAYKVNYKKSQFQAVVLPIFSKHGSTTGLGLAYKHKFRDHGNWDMFVYGGGSILLDDFDYDYGMKSVSAGLSCDYSPSEIFTLNLETGYGVYGLGDDYWSTNLSIGIGIDFNLTKLSNNK